MPGLKEVPEFWKAGPPFFGPYRQAPAEYGGEWWYVNPFYGTEPWITQGKKVDEPVYPEGFIATFGPRPKAIDFPNGDGYREAIVRFEQDLKFFKSASKPEWLEDTVVENVRSIAGAWGMGEPRFYEGRYGFMVRFPESLVKDFEASAYGVMTGMHLVVASYQLALIERGMVPNPLHPFVPPVALEN